jgi:L-alanine-DL-glutamate epimerase-like enolase superfamily enzyme
MIKLKLGTPQDLDCVRALRSVLPTVPLFVDVNSGWSLERLNRLAPELAAADVFMIEQPLARADDALLDHYNRAVPLCADESCHSRSDLDRLAGRSTISTSSSTRPVVSPKRSRLPRRRGPGDSV